MEDFEAKRSALLASATRRRSALDEGLVTFGQMSVDFNCRGGSSCGEAFALGCEEFDAAAGFGPGKSSAQGELGAHGGA